MLIDSHAHIQLENFDNDREAMLTRAQKAGVEYIIAIGFDLESSVSAISLAEQYDFVYATVGMHPHDAKLLDDGIIDKFRDLAQHPKVVALGEMGLDYYRNLSPRSIQRKAFEAQLRLAQELDIPIIVHDRETHEDIMKILRRYVGKIEKRGVLHCFSGDIKMAKEAIDLGFYISIAGPVTYPKSLSLQRVAREVPLDSLLLETDCPWLAPQFRRGKRNEPAYITAIAEKIATLRGVSVTNIADATTTNVKNLFGI
ncbi:TPA: TatD family deoxyribonuclease [Candidatus Poribacteria bacterium]|nr:TatD family deoxyribonuclease [Candidatus Poribacteria bacterium]